MSFKFRWGHFDEQFYANAIHHLERALNSGGPSKPQHICDDISVIHINMGTVAPNLEILEITDLSTEKFRGIFKMSYSGDADLILQTKVQVNPVYHNLHDRTSFVSQSMQSDMLTAHKPLIVPLQLRISCFEVDAIFSLTISQKTGLTLAFKNDPLQNVLVQSTFDETLSVRDMLQTEIEKQLRSVFTNVVPKVLHEYSMRFASGRDEDLEERLGVSRKHEIVSQDGNFGSVDSGIGQSIDSVTALQQLEEDRFAGIRTPPVPKRSQASSLSDLRSVCSAPCSPIRGKFPTVANVHSGALSMHLSPFRTSQFARTSDTKSIVSVPANLPSASSTPSSPQPIPAYINKFASISNLPSSSTRRNFVRISTSPPISPVVGLHPSNLRKSNSSSPVRRIYQRE